MARLTGPLLLFALATAWPSGLPRAQNSQSSNVNPPASPGSPTAGDLSDDPLRSAAQAMGKAGITANADGSVTIPTSMGTLRFDPNAAPSAGGAKIPPQEDASSSALSSGQIIAVSLIVLSACYLIASFWFKKRRNQTVPVRIAAESSGFSDANFPIVRVIGRGGMGVVYEAVDRALDRKVAIKKMREEMSGNPSELEQFLKEAKTVASLHHPAIVNIHSIVQQGGEIYLVFEYVEGKTVEALLTEKGRLSVNEAKRILEPICQALEFAHGRQVIHRDLKPANVMVTNDGYVKVMDFGIARKVREHISAADATNTGYQMTHSIVGTPLYMAPEAERGILCAQSDIYSLGIMTYEMLAGRPPFPPPVAIDQKLEKNFLPLSRVVPGLTALDNFFEAVLEPDPAKRLPSAPEFWNGFAAAV